MMNSDCPQCGGTVYRSADTSTGEVRVRSICVKCGWEATRRDGPAMWRVMQQQRRKGLFQWIKGLLWR